jgi:hypothetical protein
VTDCDTELYSCGEVCGAFHDYDLQNYLKQYGERGKKELLEKLAYLQYQVIDAWRNHQTDEFVNVCCKG